jgi:hypothetical protein
MGNRAVIAFQESNGIQPFGIYLQWNGGIESVAAFLDYAKQAGHRTESQYGAARLVQTIGNYFGGTLSLGICPIDPANPGASDSGDNGVFLIDCTGKLEGAARIIGHYDRNCETGRVRKVGAATMAKRVRAAIADESALGTKYKDVLNVTRERNAATLANA